MNEEGKGVTERGSDGVGVGVYVYVWERERQRGKIVLHLF